MLTIIIFLALILVFFLWCCLRISSRVSREEEDIIIESKVYNYLCSFHKGKDNLIKNKNLREIFAISSDKSMRQVIQNIRESVEYPKIIGSVSGIKGGFYCCITDQERQETINNIKHRANQMLRMAYILEKKKFRRNR